MKEKLIDDLRNYKAIDQDENEMVLRTIDYLENTDDYLGKINPEGHITGSAWIINPDKTKTLLTHHLKLNIWVQLGGHTELDETVLESAYREGIEESGLEELTLLNKEIFDVDVHYIPKRKGIEAHYHYDIRYLFEGNDEVPFVVSDESHDLKWIELKGIDRYTSERSVIRMVEKTLG